MCFNPAKSWQLGWYSGQEKAISPALGESHRFTVAGVNDYNAYNRSETVVLKVEAGERDFFIGYNKATGMNSGTQESANQVVIIQNTNKDSGYTDSLKLSSLSAGESYNISNYKDGNDLSVRFTSVASGDAVVDVFFPTGGCVPPGCFNEAICSSSEARFKLDLEIDKWGGETSWTLKNTNGAILASGSNYVANTMNEIPPICIPKCGGYVFEIVDSYGQSAFVD
jgi:hypothetical protein